MTHQSRDGAPAPWAAVIAVAVVAVLAALAGLPAHATYGARTTADEPQYLLTAISLAEDGDLDIADELAARRWRAFHEAQLPQQTRPLPGGVRISPHDPLLPMLLTPGVALGGWAGAKATLALLAGLLAGLTAWTAVVRLAVQPGTAVVVVGVYAASVPLAPYGSQIYPELPAALAVAVAVAALLSPTLRTGGVVAVVGACTALPWLGIKYAPVAAVLAGVLLWRHLRARATRRAVTVIVLLLVAGVVYLVVHQQVWTGWTVYASADHFVDSGEVGVVGFDPDYWARTTRILGLLVERSFGIAAWQPAWLLLVPAVAAAQRARLGRGVLTGVLATGWLVASYVALTMAGWWFPGRQIVVVAPIAVLLIAWWAAHDRRFVRIAGALGAVGVASWLLLAYEAGTGRVTLVVDFFETANPWYQVWRRALPDYLAPSATTWVLHAAWIGIIAGLAVYGWRTAPSQPASPSSRPTHPMGTDDGVAAPGRTAGDAGDATGGGDQPARER